MDIQKIMNCDTNVTLQIQSKDFKQFLDCIFEKFDKRIKSHIVKEEEYLTINETADILHVDKSTLWSWNKRGYLRKIEVGGRRLYKKSDVEAILQKK